MDNQIQMQDRNKTRCRGEIHVVKRGDSLYQIAKMHNVRVKDIMKANPYVNVYNLQIGDELCIPSYGSNASAFIPYIVKQNETLADILKNTNEEFEDLLKYNKKLGELKVPAGTVILMPSKIQEREKDEDDD